MKAHLRPDRINILAAILSGLMLTAAFPPATTDWFIWFALVPLLAAMNNQSASKCFHLGFITGTVHFISLMYWIVVVLGKYGGLNVYLSIFILILLCFYLAIYIGLFGLHFFFFFNARFGLLLTAGGWVCLEYLRGRLLTGLPWCFMGHSQAARLYIIQICDLVGVLGLSFLAAAVNMLIFGIIFDRGPARKNQLIIQTSFVIVLITMTLLYGRLKLQETPGATLSPMRAAVVQGNIDQSEKWLPEFQQRTIDSYEKLSLEAARAEPDLIVWPETAVPLFFQDRSQLSRRIMSIPRLTQADLLFGSPAYVESDNEVNYTNRAYLLSVENNAILTYDKVHLVPFGEYVPLQRLLPFVNRLVPAAGDFVPGDQIAPLGSDLYSAGVLICYEAVFSNLARSQVRKGADILVNLTNDAWFGKTSAPFQHFSMSVFRAVETRLPLVRAANTGISAFIDAKGRVMVKGDLFRELVLVSDIIPSEKDITFYVRYGDLVPILLLAIISVKFICLMRSRLRSEYFLRP